MNKLSAGGALLLMFLSLQAFSQGRPGACVPTFHLLESSPEARSTKGGRVTLAVVGCETDLAAVPPQRLAAAEEALRARSEKAGWPPGAMLSGAERSWASSRASALLGVPVEVFHYSSGR